MDRKRNEEICEEDGVVAVPPVLEPVPVHDHALAIPDEIRDVPVATGVLPLCTECPPYHHPA